jgi:hypothetical protein
VNENPHSLSIKIPLEDALHDLRLLKLSQIRKQLRHDEKHNLDRYIAVVHFIALAKEQH